MPVLDILPPPKTCPRRGCGREVRTTLVAGQCRCSSGHLISFDRETGVWRSGTWEAK